MCVCVSVCGAPVCFSRSPLAAYIFFSPCYIRVSADQSAAESRVVATAMLGRQRKPSILRNSLGRDSHSLCSKDRQTSAGNIRLQSAFVELLSYFYYFLFPPLPLSHSLLTTATTITPQHKTLSLRLSSCEVLLLLPTNTLTLPADCGTFSRSSPPYQQHLPDIL